MVMRFRMLDSGVLFAAQYVIILNYILLALYHDASVSVAHVTL